VEVVVVVILLEVEIIRVYVSIINTSTSHINKKLPQQNKT